MPIYYWKNELKRETFALYSSKVQLAHCTDLLSRVSMPVHAERNTILPNLSVCLFVSLSVRLFVCIMLAVRLNEWISSHFFGILVWESF